MSGFDSSDEENEENVRPVEPIRMDWLNLSHPDLCNTLALSSLPGCRFRDVQRNLQKDLDQISQAGISHAVVLMQTPEFRKYRVPDLVYEYEKRGISVLQVPLVDGGVPTPEEMMEILENLENLIEQSGTRILIHCYGGLGRTCLVAACFLMYLDPNLLPDSVISYLRNVRGPRAVQTVRQWNFIHEFRTMEQEFLGNRNRLRDDSSRSVSR
ncbi:cyclin-dependent kinase inhibitor 3 [Eurytemora carolleeae]|uniref:cyclin-dependent kinase inhibitor 3 n=1 Tax=Eurytemora carolleeae TaxID=1294199 RepID=UPI000C78FA6C|nr:cyclin-dependent kinase inhibitor 3 [Eurytemora carolleeae]|eukprot:XP_023343861.1 cyclin-dependent kinase inhibitor 3-like [Eurytemora affinis]